MKDVLFFDLAMAVWNPTIVTDITGEAYASLRPLRIYMDRKLGFLYTSVEKVTGANSEITLPEGETYSDEEIMLVHAFGQIKQQRDISMAGLCLHIATVIERIIQDMVVNKLYHIGDGVLSMRFRNDATGNCTYHFYTYKDFDGDPILRWRMYEYSPNPKESDEYKQMLNLQNEMRAELAQDVQKAADAYNELLDQHIALQEKYDKLTTIETHRANSSERKL